MPKWASTDFSFLSLPNAYLSLTERLLSTPVFTHLTRNPRRKSSWRENSLIIQGLTHQSPVLLTLSWSSLTWLFAWPSLLYHLPASPQVRFQPLVICQTDWLPINTSQVLFCFQQSLNHCMSNILRLMHKSGTFDAQPITNTFWGRNNGPVICLASYLQRSLHTQVNP